MAHTSGPWRVERLASGDFGIVYNDDGNWLAEVYDEDDPNAEDDARLIAAAPELLEALKAAKAFHDRDEGCNGFTAEYEILRAQIDEALAAEVERLTRQRNYWRAQHDERTRQLGNADEAALAAEEKP